ncbi:MAG: hypothetical protein RSB23_04835 [Alistipes sp.]
MRGATIIAALFFAGCISPHQAVVTNVDLLSWCDSAVVVLHNTDTTALRDLSVIVRFNHQFTRTALPLTIATRTPQGVRYGEPFTLPIQHTRAVAARSCELVIPYRRSVVLQEVGDYHIVITPREEVQGIEAIGINIEKSK